MARYYTSGVHKQYLADGRLGLETAGACQCVSRGGLIDDGLVGKGAKGHVCESVKSTKHQRLLTISEKESFFACVPIFFSFSTYLLNWISRSC